MKIEQYLHKKRPPRNRFVVIMLIRRLGKRKAIIKEELDTPLPEIVGALKIFYFSRDLVAVD